MKARIDPFAQVTIATSLALSLVASPVLADEGGVSFLAPGQFGSFSAVPTAPGWAVPLVYYHVSANAGASKNFFDVGMDNGSPVSEDYKPPFAYAGTIKKVEIHIAPSALSASDRERVRIPERKAAMAIE